MDMVVQMVNTYVTQECDMWDSIALSQMGDAYYSNQLIDANRQYSDVIRFSAGVVLTIPEITADKSKVNLPPWAR